MDNGVIRATKILMVPQFKLRLYPNLPFYTLTQTLSLFYRSTPTRLFTFIIYLAEHDL